MKKLLLTAVIAVSLVACNNTSTKKDGSADSTKTENKAQEPKKDDAAQASSSSNVPKFSNAEVQKLADEYATFMKEYIAAYNSKDQAKIVALGAKFQEYGTSTATTLSKMSADDAKLWSEYFTKVTEDMTKAMAQ